MQRIEEMEAHLDAATTAVRHLSEALDLFEEAQIDISILSDYYQSDDWKQDFEADENGLLPTDIKRGVLSEDGIWDLLDDVQQVKDRMNLLL